MRKNIVWGAVALAMAASVSVGAAAQSEQMLRQLDRNRDGFISRDEADAFRGGRFDELDVDGDGAVSRREMMDRLQRRMEREFDQRFNSFDADRDGRIDRREYRGKKDRFERLDRDRDGLISPRELKRARRGKD